MTKVTRKSNLEIVILDSLTLGTDIDLSIFDKYGKTTIYKTTSDKESQNRIRNADIVITNKVKIGKNELDTASNLKLICVAATGYNNIDIEASKRKGLAVVNVKNYSTTAVAQNTFSLILALENSLVSYISETRSGKWSESPIFTMINYPIFELNGKKLGILGYGAIGQRVAEIGKAFGMEVLIGKRPNFCYTDDESRVDFEQLLADSDIISIHTPLSEDTQNLFSLPQLEKMKSSAVLINTARGGIINEDDLYIALKNGIIRAAAIDVVGSEPIDEGCKLLELDNILITPHIAWASYESRMRLIEGIINNIEKFLTGTIDEINLA